MKKPWKKAAFWAAAVGLGLAAFLALTPFAPVLAAMDDQLEAIGTSSGLPTESLPIIVARIIRAGLGVLGLIVIVLIIYAGYLYLTAQGDEVPIKKAKAILRNAIIGLVIIFASFAITTFILNALLRAAGLGGEVSSTGAYYSEPLSASLGAGIIESHYPARYALDVPRNTRIMVTFKEALDPNTMVVGYAEAVAAEAADTEDTVAEVTAFGLNSENVLIYQNDDVSEDLGITAADVALTSAEVVVSFTTDFKIFVFDPVPYLGSATADTNYTVFLSPNIKKADGTTDAFSGTEDEGYEWTFEVSTEIDLTPPTVVSIFPADGDEEARNAVVQVTFSEAMDPVAATGIFGMGGTFTHFSVLSDQDGDGASENVEGTASISNQYQTVEFLPSAECGRDPCGDIIYCLPGSEAINVEARAATINPDETPQALSIGGLFDGLADAAGNSLDGDDDWGAATGEAGDDYLWDFTTTAEINDDPPVIISTVPSLEDNEEFGISDDVEIVFNMLMRSSSLNTNNVQLESDYDSADPADDYQSLWFTTSNETLTALGNTKAIIDHATLWESVEGADGSLTLFYYYPVITNDVESAYQICMFPSYGPVDDSLMTTGYPECVSSDLPYCCNGAASSAPCTTQQSKKTLGQ